MSSVSVKSDECQCRIRPVSATSPISVKSDHLSTLELALCQYNGQWSVWLVNKLLSRVAEDIRLIILMSSGQWQCVHDATYLFTDVISLDSSPMLVIMYHDAKMCLI